MNDIFSKSDPLYPVSNNQDERLLIEFNGNIVSEAEYIFYGIQDCPILEIYPFDTYERLKRYPQEKIYEEIAYFRPEDLITYLNSGNPIDYNDIQFMIEYAKLNFDYSKITYLAMCEAIKELLKSNFVKSITFILSNFRQSDERYLIDIFGKELLNHKCSYLNLDHGDNICQEILHEVKMMADANTPYTTIITNEYQVILDICKKYKEYKADTVFYLLRNHSKNMKQSIKGDSVIFEELYTDKILNAINGDLDTFDLGNIKTPIKSKFARFAPKPFVSDAPSFMTFGEQEQVDYSSNISKGGN